MRNRVFIIAAMLLMLLSIGTNLLLQNGEIAQAADAMSCTLPYFVASVREGPDKDWYITGDLKLTIAADGSVTGRVTSVDEKDKGKVLAAVMGQITGRAVDLVFDIGRPADPTQGDQEVYYLFGSGMMVKPPTECSGPMGGLFTGPRPGDIGDWDICGSPPFRPGVPKPIPCVPFPPLPTPPPLPTLLPPVGFES
jgi:hypothetical protein